MTHTSIRILIDSYQSEVWLCAYIGADHDVEAVSFSLSIDNHMAFEKSEEDTVRMFNNFQSCRNKYMVDVASVMCDNSIDADQKRDVLRKRSKNFFDEV